MHVEVRICVVGVPVRRARVGVRSSFLYYFSPVPRPGQPPLGAAAAVWGSAAGDHRWRPGAGTLLRGGGWRVEGRDWRRARWADAAAPPLTFLFFSFLYGRSAADSPGGRGETRFFVPSLFLTVTVVVADRLVLPQLLATPVAPVVPTLWQLLSAASVSTLWQLVHGTPCDTRTSPPQGG